MNRVIISAGHHKADPGHVTENGIRENHLVMKIRNEVIKLIPNAIYSNDDMTLRQTIDFINTYNPTDEDLILELHTNANAERSVRGVEVYHYNNYAKASKVAEAIAGALGIPNRGAKPDTASYVGSLGFCRQIKGGLVVELGYLTNVYDRVRLIDPVYHKKIAEAIKGLLNTPQPSQTELSYLQTLLNKVKEQLQALLRQLGISL